MGRNSPYVEHWCNPQRPTKARLECKSELEERLLADTCEYCGATGKCQVHHVRALKDLQVKGRRPKPQWMVLMAARQRKTMVVCKTCHEDITYGRPMRRRETSTGFMHGEPVTHQRDKHHEKTL